MGNSIPYSLSFRSVALWLSNAVKKFQAHRMGNPSSITLSGREVNFEFAFNNANFSDRVLHLEILSDSPEFVEAKTLHISSVILAGNSLFFHKLFDNGMRESKQRDATLRINASEEAGVMEVLYFMYSNTIKATSIPDLLGVLVAADKFEATDCVRYCCEALQKFPISLESAVMYLELPASVVVSELVQPLMDAAKKFILAHFKDFKKSQEEAMTLPLSALEVLLSSDSLQVDLLGDDLFDFIMKWARGQYPELNKRREILSENLTQFIRFRHMGSLKLQEVLDCPDLDHEKVSKLMLEALIMMVDDSYGRRIYASLKHPILKVEQYGTPQPRCVVFFDLRKEDCENLSPSSCLYSRAFQLGGRSFYLMAKYNVKEEDHSFGLYLLMNEGSQSCTVDFAFDGMKKTSMEFQKMGKTSYSITYPNGYGFPNLFDISWADFMSKDSDYFVDGILHLRADLTIKDSKA